MRGTIHRMTESATFLEQLRDIVGEERADEVRRLILSEFTENIRAENDEETGRTPDDSIEDIASPTEVHPFIGTPDTHVNHAAALDLYPPAPQSRQGYYGAHLMPTQMPFVPRLGQQSFAAPNSEQADSGFIDASVQDSAFATSANPFQQNSFAPYPFNNNMYGAQQGYPASNPGRAMPYAAQGLRQARNNSTPGDIGVLHNANALGTHYEGTSNHMRTENLSWGNDWSSFYVPNPSHGHLRRDSALQGGNDSPVQWRNSFAQQEPTDPANEEGVE
jgi:hypothetical protein